MRDEDKPTTILWGNLVHFGWGGIRFWPWSLWKVIWDSCMTFLIIFVIVVLIIIIFISVVDLITAIINLVLEYYE